MADVLRLGSKLFIGRSTRTNDAGIEQTRAIVTPLGLEVIPVDVHGCLHLKSAVTELADGVVLWNRDAIDPAPFAELRSITVDSSEPDAANVLRLGEVVIAPAQFPKTRSRIEAEGIRVVTVPQTELAKAEGRSHLWVPSDCVVDLWGDPLSSWVKSLRLAASDLI